jgi:Ca-activated chloride channel family protein
VFLGFDVRTLSFAQPLFLWLLILPALLILGGAWRLIQRRGDVQRSTAGRLLPLSVRFSVSGDLGFWLAGAIATSLCIVALARPQAKIATVHRGGADFVMLLDGSASMYTRDVPPDRWQRAVQFLRAFGEGISWKGERVALALFAHLASPQVRLTKDPNALFFFLDHLGQQSPFRLEDDPTWDTNIEEGLHWGLNLVAKDEELFGKSNNAKAFVVITDGQAWSGEVAKAIIEARDRRATIYVVGVGTTTGGIIPDPPSGPIPGEGPIHASLDRASLQEIARAGGGDYFELGRQPDREIAARIISAVRRRASVVQTEDSHRDLYWYFLFAAGLVLCAGALLLRDPAELSWHVVGSIVALLVLASAFG